MSHSDYENQLLRYFYSELDGPERESFEAHLRECQQCRVELENLKAVALGVGSALESAAPRAEIVNAVRTRAGVGVRARPRAKLGWRFSFAGVAALVLMVTATTWFLVSGSSQTAYDSDRMESAIENMEDELVAVENREMDENSDEQMEGMAVDQSPASQEMDKLEQDLDEIEGSLQAGVELQTLE